MKSSAPVSLIEVLDDAEMLKAPDKMCGHIDGITPGPGAFYLECIHCGGRWKVKTHEKE